MSPSVTTNRPSQSSTHTVTSTPLSSYPVKTQPRPTTPPKVTSLPKPTDPIPSQPNPEPNNASSESESELSHPFAGSSGLVQIIRPTVTDLIEEEAHFWDEFTTDDGLSKANTGGRVSPPNSTANRSVFSNDIWLDDNSGNTDRTFARDVQLVGWANVGDNISTGYVVYDCAIRTKEGVTIHLHKRYNSFVKLSDALHRSLPPDVVHNIPSLPSKNALAKYRPAFLDSRRRKLQTWLAAVLMHPDIGGCPTIRQWILE